MADIAAGTGAEAHGADMRGVAPDATLVDLDVGGAAVVFPSSILAAFEWLLEHNKDHDPRFPGGIRVAVGGWGGDCSAGFSCEMPVLRKLLGKVIGSGVVVVLATGEAAGGDVTYPARYPEMIAVKAACKDQDNWSGMCDSDQTPNGGDWGSVSSPSLDVVAPGVAVWAALASQQRQQGSNPNWSGPVCEVRFGDSCSPVPGESEDDQNYNRLWYGPIFSHSAATAHVAGIAALMLEVNPDLTQADVEQLLQKTARDLGPKGFDPSSGYGMSDALEAVKDAERP